MTTEAITTKTEGMTASRMVFQRLGRAAGSLEAALDATPGIASHGAYLPAGTTVRIPIPEAPDNGARERDIVTLWD